MKKKESYYYKSPIGTIEITGTDKGLTSLYFVEEAFSYGSIPSCLKSAVQQLDEYFNGKRKIFDLELNIQGTDFQKKVWKELLKIPHGATVSYLHIAKALGDRNATRAVGTANGRNPISVIVPCHRVIGSNRKLTSYAGGIDRKHWLLDFEDSSLLFKANQ